MADDTDNAMLHGSIAQSSDNQHTETHSHLDTIRQVDVNAHSDHNGESRTYILNIDKSLDKLIDSCNRQDDFVIKDVCGNIVLNLQTGMYQVFKSSAIKFYEEFRSHLLKVDDVIDVFDEKKNVVETKIKVVYISSNRCWFTINLYHTTCSAMINGRGRPSDTEHRLIEFKNQRGHTII